MDPDLSSSSQKPKDCYPTDRIILENANDSQIHTEIYVPDPEFQKLEDLANDNSALEQDWKDYNAQ